MGTEYYEKGTESMPACPLPECDNNHANELHNLLTKNPAWVNMLEYGEDDDEEGFVNMRMEEDKMPEGKDWRHLTAQG